MKRKSSKSNGVQHQQQDGEQPSHQQQQNQQAQQAQQQGPVQQKHPITRTVSQGKRWVFVLVVFVYLILSKLIARSSSTATPSA